MDFCSRLWKGKIRIGCVGCLFLFYILNPFRKKDHEEKQESEDFQQLAVILSSGMLENPRKSNYESRRLCLRERHSSHSGPCLGCTFD